jgi:hypothetical protein
MVNRSSFVVFRKNYQHDSYTSECGSFSSNCHIDEIETWGPDNTNLYEGNTFARNIGSNVHVGYFQYTGGHQTITRFNTISQVGDFGWIDDNQGYSHVKHYNETKVSVGGTNFATDDFYSGSTNGSEYNGIFYYNGSLAGGFAPYYTDSSANPFTSGCNLFYNAAGASSLSGPITTDGSQLNVNPQFVNVSGGDYHLASNSPARTAGCPLTTTSGAGSSSTSLKVADSSFFQDGYGISGVQSDCIRIGASSTVCIAQGGINYSTNTITLASPMSWNNGDPIYLYKDSSGDVVLNGANPDIGSMYDSTSASAPAAPTGLAALVN